MHKVNKRKYLKKQLLVFASILLLVTALSALIISKQHNNTNNIPGSSSTTTEPTVTTKTNATQDMPTTQPSTGKIGINVTVIGQDTKNGPVVIRTILDGADGGECSFSISNGSIQKKYSSNVTFAGTYYACTYNIPYSDISNGTWNVIVDVQQNNNAGSISQTVQVQ